MNKLTKLLSVFVIAGAIGTGIIGVAGCKKGGGETHTHSYTYTNKGATHDGACECGKDPIIGQAHSWGTDGKCTANGCDAVKPAETNVTGVTITAPEKTTIYVGDKITLTATVQGKEGTTVSQEVTWSIATGGNYASINAATGELTATAIGNVYVVATSVDGEVDSSALTIKIEERNLYAELVADTENNVIGEDFEDVSDLNLSANNRLPVYPGYTNTTPGLYEWGDGKDMTKTGGVVVEDGKAVHATDGENISMVVDLTDKVKDYVEGYVELKLSEIGSKHSIIALKGTTGTETDIKDVVAVYITTSGGDVGIRLGSQDVSEVKVVNGITLTANTVYKINFKLDMVSGRITIDIAPEGGSNVNLCTDLQTNIATLRTVAFVSSGSGKRLSTIDNIAINSSAVTDVTKIKASLVNKVDDYVAKVTIDNPAEGEDELTLTGENVTAAATAVKETINNAADAAAAKTAYATSTIDAAILANAKSHANTLLTAHRSDESFTHEGSNKDAMEKAKSDGATAIGNASDVAAVRAALKAAKAECDKVLTDDEDNTAKVTITFYAIVNNSEVEVGKLENLLDGMDTLTKYDIENAIKTYLTTNDKKLVAVYKTNTAGTLSDKVEGTYTVTAKLDPDTNRPVDTPDAKLYVELADWQTETFTVDAIKNAIDANAAADEANKKTEFNLDEQGRLSSTKAADWYKSEDPSISALVKFNSFAITGHATTTTVSLLKNAEDETDAGRNVWASTSTSSVDRALTITASEDVTLTFNFNLCDGSNPNGGKKGYLVYKIGEAEAVTCKTQTAAAYTVYTETITLKKGETVKIYSSTGRLMIFNIAAKY